MEGVDVVSASLGMTTVLKSYSSAAAGCGTRRLWLSAAHCAADAGYGARPRDLAQLWVAQCSKVIANGAAPYRIREVKEMARSEGHQAQPVQILSEEHGNNLQI